MERVRCCRVVCVEVRRRSRVRVCSGQVIGGRVKLETFGG